MMGPGCEGSREGSKSVHFALRTREHRRHLKRRVRVARIRQFDQTALRPSRACLTAIKYHSQSFENRAPFCHQSYVPKESEKR
jgi:hypothetical protein